MTQNKLNIDTGGLPQAPELLHAAWRWLCEGRRHAPAQADVWHLRFHWETQQQSLLATLLAGEYRLSPMLIVGQGSEQKAMWGAQDALVLKWVALQVAPLLPLHARCEHIKGHEGGPASVRKMSAALTQNGYRWVLRTDVKGYYANIDKAHLLNQVCRHITHPVLRDLITQYVHYTVESGGTFHTPEKGIGRSCPLSPLMGALYLQEMDEHFGREMQTGRIYYARYMDDIVVLTHSRWQLRKHVRKLNQLLAEKQLHQHPDKTFTGRTQRGFDWMGAWLEPQGVTDIAPRAKANHREKVRRLYERAWRWREPKGVTRRRVSTYRWRWAIWAGALMGLAAPALADRVVVPAGRAGYVGQTPTYHADFTGPLNAERGRPTKSVCVSLDPNWCLEASGTTNARKGYSGAWGTALSGPTSGAVAVATGTIRIVRTTSSGQRIAGQMTLGTPNSTCSWSGSDLNLRKSPVTFPAHLDSSTGIYDACVMDFYLQGVPDTWSAQGPRESHFDITFKIDAPRSGLAPGLYTMPIVYAGDFSYGTSYRQPLTSGLQIAAANYSCALSAPSSVSLTPERPTETASAVVTCADGAPPSTVTASPTLQISAAGSSTAGTDPRHLNPSNAASLSIQGAWSSTPPDCDRGDMYFDGRDGPALGILNPRVSNFAATQPMSFRLCGTAPPGQYTAQATIRVVTR